MSKKIEKKSKLSMKGVWHIEVRDAETGQITYEKTKENIIPDVALNAFASQIALSTITTDIGDNLYIAVGDDNTAVSASDTTLGNETARKAISSRSVSDGVASIVVFFASGEATGTHEEVGLFGNGKNSTASSSPDTGILFSHVNDTISISASETLTLTFSLTFSRS